MEEMSGFEKQRLKYKPPLPPLLKDHKNCIFLEGTSKKKGDPSLEKLFPKTFNQPFYQLQKKVGKERSPLRVGAVLSGGPAAGGHNVLSGLFDALQGINPHSKLIGFLGGPSGIIESQTREITREEIDRYRNLGGFDLLGSGRTKIEKKEQLQAALKTCTDLNLDGLVIIGGDDSNTNGAVLSEYFLESGCKTRVVGVPKTIDGDLRSEDIEISFGFDSACKTYSELIGNICRDAKSSRKYYHFIKLMGRSASNIALECALQTHPNLALIGEEKKSLSEIITNITDMVIHRSGKGKDYGVILIPEGIIEFIPEIKSLISEINVLLAKEGSSFTSLKGSDAIAKVEKLLTPASQEIFLSFPEKIKTQLLLERDPHGNVQVSQIETEYLLTELVKGELKKRVGYKGKFNPLQHFFGYEGRACYPTQFDANYCYTLGHLCALAVRDGLTGVIVAVNHLKKNIEAWELKAIPIIMLMRLEMRSGVEKPVIEKALVDTKGTPFVSFSLLRKSWELEDQYRFPGPIQFFGPIELTDSAPLIL